MWYHLNVLGISTNELVGHAFNKRITSNLVFRTLNILVKNKRPFKDLIVYSERGCQHYSNEYCKVINQHEFQDSMFKHSNCFDNTTIESCRGMLKNELEYHQDYEIELEVINDITKYIEPEYIEPEYNQARIQKGLGYKA